MQVPNFTNPTDDYEFILMISFRYVEMFLFEISLNKNAKQSFQINKLTLLLAFSSQLIANKNICKHRWMISLPVCVLWWAFKWELLV